MTRDQLIADANAARKAGKLYVYFRLLALAGEADTMVFGPVVTHGPEDVRE